MEKEALERFKQIESLLAAAARSNLEAREEARRQDARFNARMERWEQRMERVEARLDRAEARMDRFDRRLEATHKLVRHGMKMFVKLEQSQDALTKAQQRTEATLRTFIASFTKGGNGRFRQ